MPFTEQQIRRLKTSVRRTHVKERDVEGKTLHYVEGWRMVCEANRIFGFDAWDRETVSSECVWRTQLDQGFAAAYLTRVRIRVRLADETIVREGLGSGEAIAPTPGQAHERAAKAAETDATKRALSTFGPCFGLSLYRSDAQKPPQLTLERSAARVVKTVSTVMRERGGQETTEDRRAERVLSPQTQSQHASALSHTVLREASGSGHVYTNARPDGAAERSAPKEDNEAPSEGHEVAYLPVRLSPIDKSALTLAEPKRRRDKQHLKFVASQPCVICARTPAQAHHLRIAQPRALGRKASDEFTVPLCALHHRDLHMTGDEAEWWRRQGVEPMAIAERLWARTRLGEG